MKQVSKKSALLISGVLALAGNGVLSGVAQAMNGEDVIQQRCLECHTDTGDASMPYSRISQQRKTPEGWQMTVHRMVTIHKAKVSPQERKAVVKYLADTQGLAPAESADLRYALERDQNVTESNDPAYVEMCARCHSGARFGLQRRTEEEWQWLVHFHMGQIPTLELHSLARDRPWFDLALNEVVPKLAKDFPLQTQAWRDWQSAAKPTFAHEWSVAGYLPGKGEFSALMRVTRAGKDRFDVALNGAYRDGSRLQGQGSAVTYTGYEWRASLTIDGVKMRQVLAANEQGTRMQGRMFLSEAHDIGGGLTAQRAGAGDFAVAQLVPPYIRRGEEQEITSIGAGLKGKPDLGPGVRVVKVIDASPTSMRVLAQASAKAGAGSRDVSVGKAKGAAALVVYDKLARVDVQPAESIARIGGNGMPIEKMKATYRAVGYAAGADGKPGTEDDLRLGYMPATWSVKPLDDFAREENDLKYAGMIDSHGIFTPGDAGLNPERKMSTNNVGNLSVVGTVAAGGETVSGEAHLLVTVPRFINAPVQ